ncbi:Serine/threonine-protein kinase PknD [Pandoraea terrae]|uniref:Serine/threonine-protein kinase PknD n=1 Tax=Pandoraea terrae TaxID=1537710 RepID=A0A5E4T4G2_9BURK|nr:choice-of-anchor D domain-containing protein [Pandoraea terrae]VVD81863.1 Serine/threonine-protein kinase PknD [Pandoraea terrae]
MKRMFLFARLFAGALICVLLSTPGAAGTITTYAGGGPGPGEVATAVGLASPSGVAIDGAGNRYVAVAAASQVYRIDTAGMLSVVAGNGTPGFSGDGGAATGAQLNNPTGVAVDAAGNVYIADQGNYRIRKVDKSGTITTMAGNGPGFSGDGGAATSAQLAFPFGVAVDAAGNVYIGDTSNFRIRKVDTSGTITTIAGNGTLGFSGDGGAATSAQLAFPQGVAVDAAGNVYIADSDNGRIRKVDASGTITTIAGNGTFGFSGDGGAATSAQLADPFAVGVDAAGNVYIADLDNQRIRKVDTSGTITTMAGNGTYGFSGDGGAATSAQLFSPIGVAVDAAGNVYIADQSNQRIRKVDTSGTITTMAGNGTPTFGGDGGPATSAQLLNPSGIGEDSAGNVYIADTGNERVRRVDASGSITTAAGTGVAGFSGDGGSAASAQLNNPSAIAANAAGDVFVADTANNRIRKIASSGTITTFAGGGPGMGELATAAGLAYPSGVAVDGAGNRYVAVTGASQVYRIDTAGKLSVVAGNGTPGFSGDGGAATSAQLFDPTGVAVDAAGHVYIADVGNLRIRKVDTSGTITTIAGNGASGFSGDGGAATSAQLVVPTGVAVDAAGNVYIADVGNLRIRKVDTSGTITTIAGTGTSGFSGDGGAATGAQLAAPQGVAVDAAGNVYIADRDNSRIRKVDTSGIITTMAGNGTYGSSGDGGAATSAQLASPQAVAADAAGNVYIADDFRIRKVDTSGIITTMAGNGTRGFSGDGGAATSAQLASPEGVAVDAAGNVCIADRDNLRIRKVGTSGTITTIAGNGTLTFGGDGGPATAAQLLNPSGIGADSAGNVYIADTSNERVRRVDASGAITTVAGSGVAGFSGDGGSATSAQLNNPSAIATDAAGDVFVADTANNRVRKIAGTGTITTYAGGGPATGELATAVGLASPYGVAVDGAGNRYVAVSGASQVYRIDTAGKLSVVAGNGTPGFSGDGAAATSAQLAYPIGVAVDAGGNVYIADFNNSRIRRVDTSGTITTMAGNGTYGFSGDGGAATSALLAYPTGVAADAAGNVYIADQNNQRIRKVDTSGTITTIAGNGTYGFSGDGGAATSAQLDSPAGVAADAAGNVYIADNSNSRIRKVDTSGTITTIAGNGTPSFSGDGGAATSAELSFPFGVAVDAAGNVYIAAFGNQRIRKVDTSGTITTIAGNGTVGFSGDGGAASSAQLTNPTGVAVDAAGNVYVADRDNQRVRKVDTSGTITTIAGNGTLTFGGDGGPATSAQLLSPDGVVVDSAGSVYISDKGNARIRRVDIAGTITTVAGSGVPGFSGDGGLATAAQLNSPGGISVDPSGNVYDADQSNNRVRRITSALTSTTVQSSANPATIGQSVTLLAQIKDFGTGTPSGSVQFSDGTTALATSAVGPCNPALAQTTCASFTTTGLAAGSHNISALYSGDLNFEMSGSTPLVVQVVLASQTISFGAAPSVVVGGTGTLSATATSGLPVSFSTTSSTCSVSGTTVTGLAAGPCAVTANQAGNANYSAAPPATQTITISVATGLSPSTLTFASQLVGTTSATQTVTLTNAGTAALSVGTITTTANFTHPSRTCGTTLAAGGTCTVSVAFAPRATGNLTGTLTVGTNGTVALSGIGIAPSASITPATYAFANQQVGTTSAVQSFVYSNTGPVPITVSTVALGGAAPSSYAIASNACTGVTLAVGAACDVGVTFTPHSAGNLAAKLSVTDTTGGAAKVAASLSGVGVAPTASLTGNATFGNQQVGTTSAVQTFKYQNTGIAPITVSSVGLSGTTAASYAIATNDCTSTTLAASASCNIGVTFTPSARGNQTATLAVTDAAGGASTKHLSLSGTGVAPRISLGSQTFNYGTVSTATAATFSLTNSGSAPLVITTLALTTGTQFKVTGGTCAVGANVNNGSSCTVIVTFTPNGTTSFTDTLTVAGTGIGIGAPTYTGSRAMTGN